MSGSPSVSARAVDPRAHGVGDGFSVPQRRITESRTTVAANGSVSAAFQLIESLELDAAHFNGPRKKQASMRSRDEQVTETALFILRMSAPRSVARSQSWQRRYRALWQDHWPLFVLSVVIFLWSTGFGVLLAFIRPQYTTLFVPQELLENILDQTKWFESLAENPIAGGLFIALNNIKVCVVCFLGGLALGLGGLLSLVFNGLFLGVVCGLCFSNQFGDSLVLFIMGHGPLELTIIVASAFASFVVGRTFFMRPYALFGQRLRSAFSEAATIAIGVTPWLIGAAIIEAFISPLPFLSPWIRGSIGLLAATAFWSWTLVPEDRGRE